MSFKNQVYSVLKNNAAVAAICGDRIYPVGAEQGQPLPYVVYQTIASRPITDAVQDPSPNTQINETLIDIGSFATTHDSAEQLSRAVRSAIAANYDKAGVDDSEDTYDAQTKRYAVIQSFNLYTYEVI